MSEQNQLEEIKALLHHNRDLIKPYFGLIFWQLHEAERRLNPEDFVKHGMSLTLEGGEDEVLASFFSSYVQLWHSAQDFNAASRFVAHELGMSGDELLQTRQLFLDSLEGDS